MPADLGADGGAGGWDGGGVRSGCIRQDACWERRGNDDSGDVAGVEWAARDASGGAVGGD